MAYRVEISMVAIMVARSNVAYQPCPLVCGLRGRKAIYNPSPALARSSRAYLSARQSHRTILTDTLKSFTPISRPHAASERLVLTIDLSYNFRGTLAEPRRIKGGEYPGEP